MLRLIYEITVAGTVGPAARASFSDLGVTVAPTANVLSGRLDQLTLHELIERIQALGLELVGIRQSDK